MTGMCSLLKLLCQVLDLGLISSKFTLGVQNKGSFSLPSLLQFVTPHDRLIIICCLFFFFLFNFRSRVALKWFFAFVAVGAIFSAPCCASLFWSLPTALHRPSLGRCHVQVCKLLSSRIFSCDQVANIGTYQWISEDLIFFFFLNKGKSGNVIQDCIGPNSCCKTFAWCLFRGPQGD